jgi:nickel/cobalt exporter
MCMEIISVMLSPVRSLAAMLLGTISIAALHALIPSHWLAFAIVGRARRWPMRRTLTVTLLAGSGHVLLTTVLGFVVAFAGKALIQLIPPQAEHAATAGLLIVLGAYFVASAQRSGGHSHAHEHGQENAFAGLVQPINPPSREETIATAGTGGDEAADEETLSSPNTSRLSRLGKEPTVMGALVLGMTLSPCLDLLSVYVGAASLSWQSLLVISLAMAATTLGVMTLLVWLTLQGLQRLNLGWLERNEGIAVGGALIALGALLFFL